MSGVALIDCPYSSFLGHVLLVTMTGNDTITYDFNGSGTIRSSRPSSHIRPPEKGLYWNVPEAQIKKLRRIATHLQSINQNEHLQTSEDQKLDCISAITKLLKSAGIDCSCFPIDEFTDEKQLNDRVQSLSGHYFDQWLPINQNLMVFNRSNIFTGLDDVIVMLQEQLKVGQKNTCKPRV